MSTDHNWSEPADNIRPDFRAEDGQRAPSGHGDGDGRRQPPERGDVNGERPPSNGGAASGRRRPPAPGGPSWGPAPSSRRAGSRETAPSYPIVAQRELDDPVRRGRLGLVKRRDQDDIPRIKPHEVLVWRVGSRYVMDRRELRVHDDIVVRASSVSVVSVRPDTQVEVSFPIDSQDASEFTVKVTFICSVLDPVVVVRDGQVNAVDALIAYLRGYQDLFYLGLDHPIREVNKVRTKMAVQVKSFMTLRPPKIPGMEITSATVQIETPSVLADMGRLSSEQEIEIQKQNHAALLDSNKQDHILSQASKMDAVSHDPRAAANVSFAEGGMASPEWANRIHEMEESSLQRQRMDEMALTARQQEIADREAHWRHEKEQAALEWQHAQDEARRNDEQENQRAQVNANIELLKLYAANGHLDTHNADIEDLIRRIHGDQGGAQLTAEDRPELTEGPAPEARGPEAGREY